VSAAHTLWLVIEPYRAADLRTRLASIAPTVRMQTKWTAAGDDIAVIALDRS
jgi:hypothetical protein